MGVRFLSRLVTHRAWKYFWGTVMILKKLLLSKQNFRYVFQIPTLPWQNLNSITQIFYNFFLHYSTWDGLLEIIYVDTTSVSTYTTTNPEDDYNVCIIILSIIHHFLNIKFWFSGIILMNLHNYSWFILSINSLRRVNCWQFKKVS